MMLTFFLAGIIISFGEIRQVFSKSLTTNVHVLPPISSFKEFNSRNFKRNPGTQVYDNVISFTDNEEELLDVRIQKFKMDKVDTLHIAPPSTTMRNEVEQSYVLVTTQTIRRSRGKRSFQIRKKSLMGCHFKICSMGHRKSSAEQEERIRRKYRPQM